MPLLDRYLAARSAAATGLVLVTILSVAIAFDLLLSLNQLLQTRLPVEVSRASWILRFYLLRLPELITFMLPIALLVGCLATCGMMLRRREFIALSAAGISHRRSTRSLLLLGLLAGAVQLLLLDQVMPRIEYRRAATEDLLTGSTREGRIWTDPANHGAWYARQVRLAGDAAPEIREVVAATSDGGLYHAGSLEWCADGWVLGGGVIACAPGADGRPAPLATPRLACNGPLALSLEPRALARIFVSRHALTAAELWTRQERPYHVLLYRRLAQGLVPLLALLCALPLFVAEGSAGRLLIAALQALGAGAVPQILIGWGTLALEAVPFPAVVLIAAIVAAAAAPGTILYLRWRD